MGHFELQRATLKFSTKVKAMTQRLESLHQRLSDILPNHDPAVTPTPTGCSPLPHPQETPVHSEAANNFGSFTDISDIERVMHELAYLKAELGDVVAKMSTLRSDLTKAQKTTRTHLSLTLVDQLLNHRDRASFDLLQFKSIAPDAAAKLAAAWPDSRLTLNGVRELPFDVAKELSQYKGKLLRLDGISDITADVAAALLISDPLFELSLNGLQSIDENTATILATHKKKLCKESIECLLRFCRRPCLSEHTKELFEQVQCVQEFEDLFEGFPDKGCLSSYDFNFEEWSWKTLHTEAAARLSRFICRADGLGWTLNLNKVTTINESTARHLSKCLLHANVHLDGVTYMSGEVALALAVPVPATHPSSQICLSLNGLKELPLDVATSLAMWNGASLKLGGLMSLGVESAVALANWKGTTLVLEGMAHLAVDVAAAIAQWKGNILMISSDDVSMEAAGALAKWSGSSLDIAIPVNMSVDAGAALAKWTGMRLRLRNLRNLRGEVAYAIFQWKGETLALGGSFYELTNREAIECIVHWEGETLHYEGSSLDAEEAEVLARCRCNELDFSEVEYLEDGAAEALAKWCGKTLDLSSLLNLAELEAASLAKWQGETIILTAIERRVFFDEHAIDGRYDADLDWRADADYEEPHKRLFYQRLGAVPSWIDIEWYGPEEDSDDSDSDDDGEDDDLDDVGAADDPIENNIVHRVAENGGLALFRFLVGVWESYKYQWNPNAVDRDGWTPLLLAVKNGHFQMVKELLASTPSVKIGLATPEKHNTALHWAAEIGNVGIIDLLLGNGADPSVRNAEGKMPVHCAIDSGNLDAIRLLTPK